MFCSNCGKEVCDNAYVCIGCGCLVNRRKPAVPKTPVEGNEGSKRFIVWFFIAAGAIALALLFFNIGIWGEEWDLVLVSGILGLAFVLPAGIVSFIFGMKEESVTLKYCSVSMFVVGILV